VKRNAVKVRQATWSRYVQLSDNLVTVEEILARAERGGAAS
jgi:hypothetical protein